MPALHLDLFPYGFTIGHLRHGQRNLDTEFALQLGYDHIEMLLAQAGEDGFPCLGIGLVGDGRILFHQAVEPEIDLFLVALLLSEDSHGKAGLFK